MAGDRQKNKYEKTLEETEKSNLPKMNTTLCVENTLGKQQLSKFINLAFQIEFKNILKMYKLTIYMTLKHF